MIKKLIFYPYIIKNYFFQYRNKRKLKKKLKIKVVFFVVYQSMWKYDRLYQMMNEEDKFEPLIIVCPNILYGESVLLKDLNECLDFFINKGYNVRSSLLDNGLYLDVKQDIQPDIVFFSTPHYLTHENYLITNFKYHLTAYSPYNFGNSAILSKFHDLDFHNMLFRLYAETSTHVKYSKKHARNKGVNVIETGYLGVDNLQFKLTPSASGLWKNPENIKIIWAPHFTVFDDPEISYSSFLKYSSFMLHLLDRYKNIEILFKPHPILRSNLYNHPDWGIEKTDEYYDEWNRRSNGQFWNGDYIDYFLTSDAMIHDSGSFLIEYLYTAKPVLRTDKGTEVYNQLNSFAREAYDVHYIAFEKEQIDEFIMNLINKYDPKKSEREMFRELKLQNYNNKSAAENIMNDIKKWL